MSIASNLERLQNEITDACARAHRNPTTVALMAVSKMNSAEAVREAYEAGQRLFGENRVQEWQTKRASLTDLFPSVQAHLIGPLQNNKTSKAAEIFDAKGQVIAAGAGPVQITVTIDASKLPDTWTALATDGVTKVPAIGQLVDVAILVSYAVKDT